MKVCKSCSEPKPVEEFYRHQQMADGRLNHCKDCVRVRVAHHRAANLERIREYDRSRGHHSRPGYCKEYRMLNPEKYAATMALNNALRDGRITKQPCEVCGTAERVEGHHDDYDKPLEVRWLCSVHHKEAHAA